MLIEVSKVRLKQLLILSCCASIFALIGYSFNSCKSDESEEKEAKRITADIASYHLGELRVHKPFAYYILTEKCLPSYLMEFIALGNEKRCDVYVNSFEEKCDIKNIPNHVTYIFNSATTWTTGRNLLYLHVKKSKKEYFYHIFMDDDIIPIYTQHMIDFKKKHLLREGDASLFEQYLSFHDGYKDAIYQERDQKSSWRDFEDDLIIHSPAFAVPNLIRLPDGFESRLRMHKHWEEVCSVGKKMPKIVPALYFDELFIAYHREAAPILLPYTAQFDSISWHLSAILNIFRARALLYKNGIANYKFTVINQKHRPYPRKGIPRDIVPQYLKGGGKDLKNLIDDRELDYKMFNSWDKWEKIFMHNKDLCSGPIKYPLWRHYRY